MVKQIYKMAIKQIIYQIASVLSLDIRKQSQLSQYPYKKILFQMPNQLIILFRLYLYQIQMNRQVSPFFLIRNKSYPHQSIINRTKIYKLKGQAKIFTPFNHLFQLYCGCPANLNNFKQNKQLRQLLSSFISKNTSKLIKVIKMPKSQTTQKTEVNNYFRQFCSLQMANSMKTILQYSRILQTLKNVSQQEAQPLQKQKPKINYSFVLNEMHKMQYLTIEQKLKRLQIVEKVSKIEILGIKNDEIQFCQQQESIDQQNIVSVKILLQNIQKYFSKKQHQQYTNKFNIFLGAYFKKFKNQAGFYPPKLSLKFVMFNLQSKQFFVTSEYFMLWSLGLINQPVTYLQKINFIDKNNRESQFYMEQNQIYLNSMEREEQQNQSIDSVNNKRQKYFLEKLKDINSFIKQITKTNLKKDKNIFEGEKERETLKISQNKISWQNLDLDLYLDQFIGVYNYVMMIYHFRHGHTYQYCNQKMFMDTFQVKNNKNKTYQKQLFAKYCLENKKKLWQIFYDAIQDQNKKKTILFQMQKQIQLTFQQIGLVFNQNPQKIIKNIEYLSIQFQQEIKKRKYRNNLFSKVSAFITDSKSTLFVTVHNPVRYVCVYLLYKLCQQTTDFQTFQFQNNFRYGEYISRRKVIQENTFLKRQQQILRDYKKKAYQKIKYYQQSQNKQIRELMNQKLKSLIQKIQKWELQQQKKERHQSVEEFQIIQIVDMLLKFTNQFILNRKLVNIKQRQLLHQMKKSLNNIAPLRYPVEGDIFGFCGSTLQFNNYLLLIITSILKDLPSQTLNLPYDFNLEKSQKLNQQHMSLTKQALNFRKVHSKYQNLSQDQIIQRWKQSRNLFLQIRQNSLQIYLKKVLELSECSSINHNIKNQLYFIQDENKMKEKHTKPKSEKCYVQKVVDYSKSYFQFQKSLIEKLLCNGIFDTTNYRQKWILIGINCDQKLIQLINNQLVNKIFIANSQTQESWLSILKLLNEANEENSYQYIQRHKQLSLITKSYEKNIRIQRQKD